MRWQVIISTEVLFGTGEVFVNTLTFSDDGTVIFRGASTVEGTVGTSDFALNSITAGAGTVTFT